MEYTIQRAWGNGTTVGRTVLSNVFAQNSSLAPFFDLSLGRALDLEDNGYDGTLLIGTHAPEFAAITQAPQVARVGLANGPGQWLGYVDGFMINGRNLSLAPSAVKGTPSGKLVALFDSGTSNAAVSPELVDTIGAAIPGSIKVNGTWLTPCYSAVNLTVGIG